MIRQVHIDDAKSLLEIYNYYVLNSVVTFDIEPLSLAAFEDKMTQIIVEYPFLVFEENDELLGYAYGSRFRPKPAYKNTVETTVYVKNGSHGKQIGTQLYKELLRLLSEQNLHMALGVLTLPNDASVKLHEKFNFKLVGHLKEVGFKFGKWLDVGIFQLNL